jgi:hypothetical protein
LVSGNLNPASSGGYFHRWGHSPVIAPELFCPGMDVLLSKSPQASKQLIQLDLHF